MKFKFGLKFFTSAFDSLLEQIAVINQTGDIIFVNRAWRKFGEDNNGPMNIDWVGVNYLSVFNGEFDEENNPTDNIKDGILSVLNMTNTHYVVDYPCDNKKNRQWFSMRISKLDEVDPPVFIVSHFDITERKRMEDDVRRLSMTDSLTGLANRRHLESHLEKEWNRAIRAKYQVSCIIIDVDYFKHLNDRYGHLIGDECLMELSNILSKFNRRESDIAARLGGEEFALIFANLDQDEVFKIAEVIRTKVMDLKMPLIEEQVTISCGVASLCPVQNMQSSTLIQRADHALYEAKNNGRNQTKVFMASEE